MRLTCARCVAMAPPFCLCQSFTTVVLWGYDRPVLRRELSQNMYSIEVSACAMLRWGARVGGGRGDAPAGATSAQHPCVYVIIDHASRPFDPSACLSSACPRCAGVVRCAQPGPDSLRREPLRCSTCLPALAAWAPRSSPQFPQALLQTPACAVSPPRVASRRPSSRCSSCASSTSSPAWPATRASSSHFYSCSSSSRCVLFSHFLFISTSVRTHRALWPRHFSRASPTAGLTFASRPRRSSARASASCAL